MKYTYSDGSGNSYVIRSENTKTIEYLPVKPQSSSSSLYDGGNHLLKVLNEIQYDQIISVLNEAINNTECHIENRIKTSGMIIKSENKVKEEVIIKQDSNELSKIELILQTLIQ